MGANILIMDTSAAIPLSIGIAPDLLDRNSTIPDNQLPKSYLDLLSHLPSKLISEIHIPNSVVQEWIGYSCFMEDGKLKAVRTVPEYEMYAGYDNALRFLQFALAGTTNGHPKIVIDCSPEGTDYVKKYLDLPLGGKEREEALNKLRQEDGLHIGEWDCAQLAYDHLAKYKSSATVLMDDNGGLDMLARERWHYHKNYGIWPNIGTVNSRAMLEAMDKSGMLWQAGFKDDVRELDISQQLVEEQNLYAKQLGNDRNYYIPNIRAEGKGFADSLKRVIHPGNGFMR